MSVYNDMASDAGYRYGTRENEQMARMIEQQEQEEMYRQHQMQAEAMAHARAQGEYEQEKTTMTEKQMTDEELAEKLFSEHNCLVNIENYGNYSLERVVTKENFIKALSESRKGMFTEEEVITLMQCCWNDIENEEVSGTRELMKERIDQYLTERKGRGWEK